MSQKGKIKQSCRKSSTGFTLIELLIAATLVMIVFGSILSLVNYSIYATTFIQNNLIASFLAQEGIELTIKKRGENWVLGKVFDNGLAAGDYRADYAGIFDTAYGEPIKFDENFGYQYSQGNPTSFKRKITIQPVTSDHFRVISEVTWKSKAKDFKITVEDHLYNWFGVKPE